MLPKNKVRVIKNKLGSVIGVKLNGTLLEAVTDFELKVTAPSAIPRISITLAVMDLDFEIQDEPPKLKVVSDSNKSGAV